MSHKVLAPFEKILFRVKISESQSAVTCLCCSFLGNGEAEHCDREHEDDLICSLYGGQGAGKKEKIKIGI